MFDGPWWMSAAEVLGALSFVVIVIDFFVAKRKIPFYIIAVSLVAFGGGLTYGIILSQSIFDLVLISLLCLVIPLIVWFLCGGSLISKSRRNRKSEK